MSSEEEAKYVFDAESVTETARLMFQGRLLTRGAQRPLTEQSDLSTIHEVLDVACGPGAWTLDVAHRPIGAILPKGYDVPYNCM